MESVAILENVVSQLPPGLRRFARLESFLAILLVFTPLALIWADGGTIRDSISAYYDVAHPNATAFYVPLTAAAMLFIVNGTIRDGHVYNVLLGVALLGVVLLDHEGATSTLHKVCAGAFFGGNFVVMMICSTHKSRPFKALIVAITALAIAVWIVTSLFWAEWLSLAVVATHDALDSIESVRYRALKRTESVKLLP